MRRTADFRCALRTGRRSSRGCLVVHMARCERSTDGVRRPARVGFVVPRAVGGAVVRNRVKRRLRALMASRLAAGDLAAAGADLVVVRALPAARDASFADLGGDLDGALAGAVRRLGERTRARST